MRATTVCALAACAAVFTSAAAAYSLDCKGDACDVSCDNGQKIGTMYWNGSVWSDGLRWDADKHVVAKLMVKAWGSACT